MTTLIIAAHPDDETLGAGATIRKLTGQGERVHVTVIGRSRVPHTHTERAIHHLGATFRGTMQLEDQHFDTHPINAITTFIEEVIRMSAPRTIITHHPGDLNTDHRITYDATMAACRPLPDNPVRTIYAMEIPSSTDWACTHQFRPTTYHAITELHLNRKTEAMEMYETERRPYPHPRSSKALIALAEYRGIQAGLEYAEAFQLIRHTQT